MIPHLTSRRKLRASFGHYWGGSQYLAWRLGRAYFGQPVCIRCGRDEWGFHWLGCVDLWPYRPDEPSFYAMARRVERSLTCAVYEAANGPYGWCCDPCEEAMRREREDE